MSWKITFEGDDSHDNPLLANAHDFAVRDLANALYNNLARLNGGSLSKAVVETDSTGEIDFIPAETVAADTEDEADASK